MLLKYRATMVAVITLLLCVLAIIFYYSQQKDEPLPPMTVKEKKARFISLILPAVDTVYAKLQTRYETIQAMIEKGQNHERIDSLKDEYKVTSDEELLIALKPHPKSIAIAQAAMESSWATSRFFRQANNVFGVWSFNDDEPRIAALQKRGDKTIWVKKYSTIEDAVFDYYRTLGRGRAFSEFRQLNYTSDDPFKLVAKLDSYSEKGSEYGEELAEIIEYNNFDRFDEN
ncbi:glucosaminidase domain-containing protein [Thalassotalea sp. 1_MG-2023]|uniref:glucosaminidase domain-containing protein n=1 Tax=Thalassotalea sp. 1_MG-2023 TaxID=3062680 RepID=UPI0026E24771|nr:glucosaminidase domain-containing protein [Thalassotalea sp. 1_MG-2023]MDO6427927.1 glucosaminidase domain-containing protein [Thalassotalea sp. 1_MG-2023]